MRSPDGMVGPVGTECLSDVRASLKANKDSLTLAAILLIGGMWKTPKHGPLAPLGVVYVRHHAQGSALP